MADLAPILATVRAHRSQARILSVLTIAGGAAAVALGVSADLDKAGAAGVLLFLFGVGKLLFNLGSAEKHKGYVLLSTTPERVVWAYFKEVRGMQTGDLKERDVVLATDDGKTVEIPTSSKENGQETLRIIEEVAPRARIGFDAALAEQFKREPASLRVQ